MLRIKNMLIRPIWDWNKVYEDTSPVTSFNVNQTNLGLKLGFISSVSSVFSMLIRPIWDWNLFKAWVIVLFWTC